MPNAPLLRWPSHESLLSHAARESADAYVVASRVGFSSPHRASTPIEAAGVARAARRATAASISARLMTSPAFGPGAPATATAGPAAAVGVPATAKRATAAATPAAPDPHRQRRRNRPRPGGHRSGDAGDPDNSHGNTGGSRPAPATTTAESVTAAPGVTDQRVAAPATARVWQPATATLATRQRRRQHRGSKRDAPPTATAAGSVGPGSGGGCPEQRHDPRPPIEPNARDRVPESCAFLPPANWATCANSSTAPSCRS
jgi:hypothetical protein